MKFMWRVAAGLLALCVLITIPWERVVASNMTMVSFAQCLAPIGWVSFPDQPWTANPNHPVPSAICLEKVRREARGSERILARLELIAGDIAAGQTLWDAAIVHYRNAVELIDHPVPRIWSTVVGIYIYKLEDYETALTVALQALQSSPGDQALRESAGLLYLFYVPPYSNYAQAIAAMRPELGLSHPYYYNIAVGAYLALGQFENGLRMAQESVRLGRSMNDATVPTGLYLLGLIQRCMGQSESGISNLREAQTLSPQDENIRSAMTGDVVDLCKLYGKAK